MLVVAQVVGECTRILDTITNRHVLVKMISNDHGVARIGYECDPSLLLLRQAVINKNPSLEQMVRNQLNRPAQVLKERFVGRIVSGTVTGTSDITRRGLIVATLGNLDPDAETPVRLLMVTEAKDWHIINKHPISDILTPSGTELYLQQMFTTSRTAEAVEEAFA